MSDILEKRTLHSIGNVKVVAKRIADYDADTSDLGEFCEYKAPQTAEQKLVHRASGLVLDHHGIWRNKRGHIKAEPEYYGRGSREYEFTFHDNGHDRIAYALADSQRLEDINNGSVGFIGVEAEVYLNGVDIGSDSIWGIETDSEEGYIRDTEREMARCALVTAHKWLRSVCPAA